MYDTLIHISSETETVVRSLQNIFVYYLLLTKGQSDRMYPAIVSMNQLAQGNVYDSGIAKYNEGNIFSCEPERVFSNYRNQYCQVFNELKQDRDYVGVALDYAQPLSEHIKIQGVNGNWAYITKYSRNQDGVEFYFIQLTQTFNGYRQINSFRAISELVMYIQHNYPGEYIFTGDFNVHGHEKVFEHFLGSKNYHIAPFYKYATCNDNEGVAAPDGIVVSKKLYNRVEYDINLYPGYSYQHFIVSAKMYIQHQEPGTVSIISNNFQFLIDRLAIRTKRDNFIGDDGPFDPLISQYVGTKDHIYKATLKSGGPKTYRATQLTEDIVAQKQKLNISLV